MPLIWRVDPELLDPEFRADLDEVVGGDTADWYATHGFRTREEQAQLHSIFLAGGPKAAPAGLSPHEFGLAVDLALDGNPAKARLQPDWNPQHPDWVRLRKLVEASPRLHGGWWFGDGDHIERTKWKEHKPAGSP